MNGLQSQEMSKAVYGGIRCLLTLERTNKMAVLTRLILLRKTIKSFPGIIWQQVKLQFKIGTLRCCAISFVSIYRFLLNELSHKSSSGYDASCPYLISYFFWNVLISFTHTSHRNGATSLCFHLSFRDLLSAFNSRGASVCSFKPSGVINFFEKNRSCSKNNQRIPSS